MSINKLFTTYTGILTLATSVIILSNANAVDNIKSQSNTSKKIPVKTVKYTTNIKNKPVENIKNNDNGDAEINPYLTSEQRDYLMRTEHNVKKFIKVKNQDTEFVVGGEFDVSYGNTQQTESFDRVVNNTSDSPCSSIPGNNTAGSNRCKSNGNSIATNGKLSFSVTKHMDAETKYGAYFKLNANPSKAGNGSYNNADSTFLFMEKKSFGRLEIGSNDGAANQIKISALKIARATGGIDGSWSDWVVNSSYYLDPSDKIKYVKNLFLKAPYLPYIDEGLKKSNKITYLSPQISGFSFGVTYMPDVSLSGTTGETIKLFKDHGYINVVDAAIGYNKEINSNININLSLSCEYGQAKTYIIGAAATTSELAYNKEEKVNNLRAWEVGGQIKFNKIFTVATSYGDSGESGMLTDYKLYNGMKKQNKFWTAGLSYEQNKFGASFTYMQSRSAGRLNIINSNEFLGYADYYTDNDSFYNTISDLPIDRPYNKLELFSLGVDYKIVDGFMPYAEITRAVFTSPIPKIKSNTANVIILGTKVSF